MKRCWCGVPATYSYLADVACTPASAIDEDGRAHLCDQHAGSTMASLEPINPTTTVTQVTRQEEPA
jgi:hypothetical protein